MTADEQQQQGYPVAAGLVHYYITVDGQVMASLNQVMTCIFALAPNEPDPELGVAVNANDIIHGLREGIKWVEEFRDAVLKEAKAKEN